MINATAFGLSNAVGADVALHFKNLTMEQKQQSGVELEDGFFNTVPFDDFENAVTESKVSKPLFDRFQIKTVAFPPSVANLVKILRMKLGGISKLVREQMKIEPTFTEAEAYLQTTAEKPSAKDGAPGP